MLFAAVLMHALSDVFLLVAEVQDAVIVSDMRTLIQEARAATDALNHATRTMDASLAALTAATEAHRRSVDDADGLIASAKEAVRLAAAAASSAASAASAAAATATVCAASSAASAAAPPPAASGTEAEVSSSLLLASCFLLLSAPVLSTA